MKKILALVLCLTALVMLPGFSFSAEKQVPDKTLEWAVEDYLESLELGEPENTEVEIEHDLDEATHTDTVTIHVSAEYPGLTAASSCVTTYVQCISEKLRLSPRSAISAAEAGLSVR